MSYQQHLEDQIDSLISAINRLCAKEDVDKLDMLAGDAADILMLPPETLPSLEILTHPFMLWHFAWEMTTRLRHGFGVVPGELEDRLAKGRYHENIWVRLRRFRPTSGYYYGFSFRADDAIYDFWDDQPILLTRIPQCWIDEQDHMTELGWIARSEVRVLSSLAFSVSEGYCHFQLTPEVTDLPGSLVLDAHSRLTPTSLSVAISTNRLLERLSAFPSSRGTAIASNFDFRSDGIVQEKAWKFYSQFSSDDDLSLRTGFNLLKSAMLWNNGNRIYFDDACINLFFGLEGCLRLISRNQVGSSSFEFKPTMEHIRRLFVERPGYPDMLVDAYEKRTAIVHPASSVDPSWIPFLQADDFYEGFGMAIDLFYYAIVGEVLPREF